MVVASYILLASLVKLLLLVQVDLGGQKLWGGGGLVDYIVSFLGQVIVIVISRPRSLTIECSRDLTLTANSS